MSAALRPASFRTPFAGVLFAEDFDDTPDAMVIAAAPEPEIIAPVFTLEDLDIVRTRAHAEGRAAATAEAEAATAAAVAAALHAVAGSVDRIAAEARSAAARDAEEVARLLLDTLLTLLPAMCAHHAETEVRAVARAVLPALTRQASITVRVNPDVVAAMRAEFEQFDPDLADKIKVVPMETMPPSDVRVSWANGSAVRDTRAVWNEIADVLRACGLHSGVATSPEGPRHG